MVVARRWAAWWGAWLLLWSLATSFSVSEVIAGAVVAALAATLSVAAVRSGGVRFHLDLALLRPLGRVPVDVARDTFVVARAIVRHLRGTAVRSDFGAVAFPVDREDRARATARSVVATSGITLAPNTIVVGIDDERGLLLVHQLDPVPDIARTLSHWAGPQPRP